MSGAVVSEAALVVKLKSPELAGLPAASTDFTRKWYVVLAARPLSPWECAVTSVALSEVADPYAVVVPYSTWLLVCSLVVQVTVAELAVPEALETALMTGGVVSAA